jgi:hypothetical protein
MTKPTASLSEIQQCLLGLIRAPSGIAAALAEGGPEGLELSDLIHGDTRLSAEGRLEIYANAYFYRILERLTEDFPTLAQLLGEAWFHDLVTAYLLACPPRHPSLRFAGDRVSAFLGDDPRGAPFRARFPWARDVARLEWAVLDAFDAPDDPQLTRETLAAVPQADWPDLVFEFHPAFQLLNLDWTARRVRSSVDAGEATASEALAEELNHVAVWRADERVFHRGVDADEFASLEVARAGDNFGEQCARLADRVGDSDAPAVAVGFITRWIDAGWLTGVATR